ncbi:MAG: putative PEP-binding protein, partial [bacterium]
MGPKMMDVGRHPRIQLLTNSQVENVTGFVGNFKVTVRKKARYVDEAECTACGDCADVCPVAVVDEYQQGFSSRKAIYIPFPQAVPSSYILDMDNCLGTNPIACGKCAEACEKKCIDYDVKDEIVDEINMVFKEKKSRIKYTVGTMIEVPRAALTADEIATEAQFFSFGTNDLTQMTLGFSRDDAGKFLGEYVNKGIYDADP